MPDLALLAAERRRIREQTTRREIQELADSLTDEDALRAKLSEQTLTIERLESELGNAAGDRDTAIGNWDLSLDEKDALRAKISEFRAITTEQTLTIERLTRAMVSAGLVHAACVGNGHCSHIGSDGHATCDPVVRALKEKQCPK